MIFQFSVLASGSKGNSTYVKAGDYSFLIDCGTSCRKIEEGLEKIGVDPYSIQSVLVTHEHTDHIKSVHTFCRKYNSVLFCTEDTYHACRFAERKLNSFEKVIAGEIFQPIDDIEIFPCPISHDAVDPVGFIIKYKGIKFSHMTDLGYTTELVAHSIKDSDAIVLEFNHDPQLLKMGDYPWALKQRILSRSGHLSNSSAAELLERIGSDNLRHVVLAHLSEDNNNHDIAMMTVLRKLDQWKGIQVDIARQNEPTPLYSLNVKQSIAK